MGADEPGPTSGRLPFGQFPLPPSTAHCTAPHEKCPHVPRKKSTCLPDWLTSSRRPNWPVHATDTRPSARMPIRMGHGDRNHVPGL
ncbi:hypothetical protein BC939DRAFT_465360 [Gamsiella multidivaricata]|uniref:uncharacterized protein n=1 Tax=Gamsiella multidivaricata TaxID=101098 RepID=UPI002220D533|nr:uncharacterized protein BC939DRAFT_465360 [Gamsiella multidivaricata]KAI7817628.1 hypothetical protein BC939DRAFT_465360 [Gamsiella multidivaricata]